MRAEKKIGTVGKNSIIHDNDICKCYNLYTKYDNYLIIKQFMTIFRIKITIFILIFFVVFQYICVY